MLSINSKKKQKCREKISSYQNDKILREKNSLYNRQTWSGKLNGITL